MPPTDEITLGEVARKVDDLANKVDSLATTVADRPSWQDIRRVESAWQDKLTAAVKQREIVTRNADQRINTLEAWQTWAGRLFIGAVVTAIISAIFIVKP